jgi:hypothetical protein
MQRIKLTQMNKIWNLLMALIVALPAIMAAGVRDVQAGGAGPIPLIGVFAGWGSRNKVYRTAEGFIDEKARYYDALRDTARQQLLDRETTYGLRDNQVGAYVKLVALIEGEREAMIAFAESEKKAARDEFIDIIQDEITNRMLASTPATKLLGAMGKGINSSQDFLNTALDKLAGGSGGTLEEIQKVKKIAQRMTIAGQLIGGNFGQTIRSAGANVADIIGKPTAEIEAGLIQVQEELGELGDLISEAQQQGYTPTASQTTREVVIALVTGDSDNPAIAAIADMLTAKHGGGGDFRDRAKAILLGNTSARCAARTEQIRQVVLRLEMNIEGEESPDDSDLPTCQVIDIPTLVAETIKAAETAGAGEAESTPQDSAADEVVGTSQPGSTAAETGDLEYTGSYSSSSGGCTSGGEFEFRAYESGSVSVTYRQIEDSCSDSPEHTFSYSIYGTHQNGTFEAPFNDNFILKGSFDANSMSGIAQNEYGTYTCQATRVK